MGYYLSWFDTHAFLLDSKPTTTAAALTGEITSVNSITGGNPSVNIKENYHIDKGGWADKTPLSRNIEDIEINFDREADSVYSTTGTDAYSKFRNWQENAPQNHKYLVVVYYRGLSTNAKIYEGICYDVINAGMTEGEKGPDDIQSISQRLCVSGERINVLITESSGTFSVALPSS